MADEKAKQEEFKNTKERKGEVCMTCFQVKPMTGVCPNCDE